MRVNRVVEAIEAKRLAFGIYVTGTSTKFIETLANAGLDYIRIDMDGVSNNPETIRSLIHTAHAVGITPFVRVPSFPNDVIDDGLIQRTIEMGAMGIIVPRATGRAYVEAAVRAAKGLPLGERRIGAGGMAGGYGQADSNEYREWSNKNILLSVQVETKAGVEAIDEIVSVPGLDMVQSGRGDLSYEYGVPGQGSHPIVLDAERRMVEAGLKAGKIVSVQYYPLRDPAQMDSIRDWIAKGVKVLNLGGDTDLAAVYRRLMSEIRG